MRYAHRSARLLLALTCLLCHTNPAAANPAPPGAQPTGSAGAAAASHVAYILRITNILCGAVEVSIDRGTSWHVIARVVQAATSVARRPGSATGRVSTADDRGIALGVGPGRCLRVLPDTPAARKDTAAIVVTSGRGAGPFAALHPHALDVVMLEMRRQPIAMPDDYGPQDGDVLRVNVDTTPFSPERLAEMVSTLAAQHTKAALERITAAGEHPVTGTLTVTAKLGDGPHPGVVVIMTADSGHSAILSNPPYEIHWDTRTWPDGEHVIEVQTLSASGVILGRKRTLVFVRNAS